MKGLLMGRNWKITPEQARIFVDELIDQISQSDLDLPELFRVRYTERARYPHSWPQFFRAMADALEMNKEYRMKTPTLESVPTDETGRTRGEV